MSDDEDYDTNPGYESQGSADSSTSVPRKFNPNVTYEWADAKPDEGNRPDLNPDDPDPRKAIDDGRRRHGEGYTAWKQRVLEARQMIGIESKPVPLEVKELPAGYRSISTDTKRAYWMKKEIKHRERMNEDSADYDENYALDWYSKKRKRHENNRLKDAELLQNVRDWQERNGLKRESSPESGEESLDSGLGFYNMEFEKIRGDPGQFSCRECEIEEHICSLVNGDGAGPCEWCEQEGHLCEPFIIRGKARGPDRKGDAPRVKRKKPLGGVTRNFPIPNSAAVEELHGASRHARSIVPSQIMDSRTVILRDEICKVCNELKLPCDKESPCGNCRSVGIPCVRDVKFVPLRDSLLPIQNNLVPIQNNILPFRRNLLPPSPFTESSQSPGPSPVSSRGPVSSQYGLNLLPASSSPTLEEFAGEVASEVVIMNLREQARTQKQPANNSVPGTIDPFAQVTVRSSSRDPQGEFILDVDEEVVSQSPEKYVHFANTTKLFTPLQECINTEYLNGAHVKRYTTSEPISQVPRVTIQDLDDNSSPDFLGQMDAKVPYFLPYYGGWQSGGKRSSINRLNGTMTTDFLDASQEDFLKGYPPWNPAAVKKTTLYNKYNRCTENNYSEYEEMKPELCNDYPTAKCHIPNHYGKTFGVPARGYICEPCHGKHETADIHIQNENLNRAYMCSDCADDLRDDKYIIKTGKCVCFGTMDSNHLCHEHFARGWDEITLKSVWGSEWVLRNGVDMCLSCNEKPQNPASGAWVCKACHSLVRDKDLNAVYFSGLEEV